MVLNFWAYGFPLPSFFANDIFSQYKSLPGLNRRQFFFFFTWFFLTELVEVNEPGASWSLVSCLETQLNVDVFPGLHIQM